jgi:hypothetical protein
MEISEAQKCIELERSRWLSIAARVSDDELMRRRERLLNRFTMFFALFALASSFLAGLFGLGTWGCFICVAGAFVAARQCTKEADHCRDARQLLEKSGVHDLDELLRSETPGAHPGGLPPIP